MRLPPVDRVLFRACWVLWRITSPTALVVVFLTLGTLAMTSRLALHDWLTACNDQLREVMNQRLIEQGQLPINVPADLHPPPWDKMIAAAVLMASVTYWMLAELLLLKLDALLRATTRRARQRKGC